MKFPWTRHIEWLEREIEDLKNRHAIELQRALDENKRLLQECDRIRLSLGQPGVLEPPPEPERYDPDAPPSFSGSAWERIVQREQWMESPAGKNWMAKLMAQSKIGNNLEEKDNAKSN